MEKRLPTILGSLVPVSYFLFFHDVPVEKWKYVIALVSIHFSVWIVVLFDIYNMISRNMDSRPVSWLAPRMDTVRQYLKDAFRFCGQAIVASVVSCILLAIYPDTFMSSACFYYWFAASVATVTAFWRIYRLSLKIMWLISEHEWPSAAREKGRSCAPEPSPFSSNATDCRGGRE
jgi:hypothetical protein